MLGEPSVSYIANMEAVLRIFKIICGGFATLAQSLEMLNDCIIFSINIMQQSETEWFTILCPDIEKLAFTSFQSLQICWTLLKSHDIVKARHEWKQLIPTLSCRAWVLFYLVLKQLLIQEDSIRAQNILAEILIWGHEQLGHFSICSGDGGYFLKKIVEHISMVEPYYHYEIYQCLHCMYGTAISVSSAQQLSDHKTSQFEFNLDASELIYRFIQPILNDKIKSNNYRSIGKDIRDLLDVIGTSFESKPELCIFE